jgi:hypothetical protein
MDTSSPAGHDDDHHRVMPTPLEMDLALRRLLERADLPARDRLEHDADGSIVAFWDEAKLVVDPDEEGR